MATWPADELSKNLRVRCFGQIHLTDGIPSFCVERYRTERIAPGRTELRAVAGGAPPRAPRLGPDVFLERGLMKLQRAEARLPHVSRGYFVM